MGVGFSRRSEREPGQPGAGRLEHDEQHEQQRKASSATSTSLPILPLGTAHDDERLKSLVVEPILIKPARTLDAAQWTASSSNRAPATKPATSAGLPLRKTMSADKAHSRSGIGGFRAPSLGIPLSRTITSSLPSSSALTGVDKPKALDIDDYISRLLEAGWTGGKVRKTLCLKNAEVAAVCHAARDVFLSQSSLIEISPPVKIVGDVHGQYTDLLRLFDMCGFPPQANYLFLGDYVDRGRQSLETILLLFCYKIKYPENFFLLRGNHECANVTRVYGFYDECKRRTSIKMWKTFVDVFNCLPIAGVVASKIFCVHGGLSPSLNDMNDIRAIERPTDVPDYGLLSDLLWSDPSENVVDWEDSERGVSYCFGKSVIQDFLAKNDFDLVCRAHMVRRGAILWLQ